MREILFRGKRVDNGEWVNGWYCEACYGAWPLRPSIIPMEEARDGYYRPVEIDPVTVGQYTGLTDKTGKKIWEGDKFDEYNSVEYCNGCFCVNGDVPLSYWAESREVIGNIYDNPELLQN